MDARTATLLLALVLAPWGWSVLRGFLHELTEASRPDRSSPFSPRSDRPNTERPAPVGRVLAFRGPAGRTAAHGRWEGGFGRRNL